MDDQSEEELLVAARAGEPGALDALIARCQPRVYRFGMRMCRDEEDARDVLQETLIALARSVRDIRGTSRLSTWLYSVARSFCIKQRRKGRLLQDSSASQSPADHADDHHADDTRGPEETLLAREMEAGLRRALQALSPEHREVIILRDGEGLTAPEVAEVLKTSVEAVKSRLHRARISLREQLAPVIGADLAARPPERCPDILTTYSRYLEDEISADFCRTMEDHLAGCRHCTSTCDSLKRALAVCGAPSHDAVPAAIQDAVRQALRDAEKTLKGSE